MQHVIITAIRILVNQHIDPYNMKLILSCLKQTLTPTLGPITPTGTKTPEETDRTKEALATKALAVVDATGEITQSLDIYMKENLIKYYRRTARVFLN